MKIYKVGGAVRDFLMRVEPKDIDYVVVGSTPEQMISLGYLLVGASFPVFLHPETQEEHALARIDCKSGNGYHGFTSDFNSNVTLKEDLGRRDCRLNSIAMDSDGNIIDPFNGADDIRNKILRHTTMAFCEDPVRVLRLARFSARFTDFTIAPETIELCKQMIINGELDHLTAERVSEELFKALSEKMPSKFFDVLHSFGALEILFPEIHALIDQTQPVKWHQEGCAYVHTMMVIDEAAKLKSDQIAMFSALVHDFGKGVTPKEMLPKHHGHEAAGVPIVDKFCKRLKISNEIIRIAKKVTRYHGHVHKTNIMNAKTFVKMFDNAGGHNSFSDWEYVAQVAYIDCLGRISDEPYDSEQYDRFVHIMKKVHYVKLSSLFSPEEIQKLSVDKIKTILYGTRIKAVKGIL